jgi:polysaccharide biosynthesis protein PslG
MSYSRSYSTAVILASLLTVCMLDATAPQFARGESATTTNKTIRSETTVAYPLTGYASHNLEVAELRDIRMAGGSFVRTDFSMGSVQPTSPASFSWETLDAKVAAATAEGLQVLGILDYSPQWNARSGCIVGSPNQCAPVDPKAFARFAAAAAAHFPQVMYWEIWNEPNLMQFWGPAPTSADYVTLLNEAYAAIKAVAPNAVILSGGLSRGNDIPNREISPVTFVTSMYANRAKFDVLALHPYTYPFSPNTANSGNGWPDVAAIREIMVANGDSSKKIWITELGVPTCGPGKASAVDAQPFGSDDYMTEAAQRTILSEAIEASRSVSYIGAMFVYEIMDDNSNDPSTRENCFGIFRSDDSPKAAVGSFRNN